MTRGGSALSVAAAAFAVVVVSALAAGPVWGAFSSKAAVTGSSTITAATDFRAPVATDTVIAKTTGGHGGFIKKSGTYYVYANVTDAGSPASGVSTVKANLSTITPAQTAASLSAGTFTVDGVAYNRRSAAITAASTIVPGALPYTLTMTDVAGNSRTEAGFSVDVDNTVPTAADIQTSNGGAIAGRADAGDKITFTYSEEPEQNSILAGWSGASTSVVVRLNQVAAADTVTIYNATNATLLPLGTIALGRTDYTTANLTFGATGTASTMVLSGNQVFITLGTQSAAATTAAATGTMTWTPSATVTDLAGNATATTADTESGAADKDF
ncbi:MAG TPA: hypothetical protein VHR18_14350 [Solirubrobacterales bacterium]|nr:hypothetical protein [Solirubrobacterales bacterium]